jgi:Heterokaryon incompatibility protein (HET)
VALSYCWGKAADHASTLKTTRNTLQRMQNGVPFSELASTLRDAIEVTLRLGMNMIWIDALCILQGDPTDWAEESKKMADIYGGAFLVIQAASCSSVNDSFLSRLRDNLTLDETQNIKARRLNAFGHHCKTGYRVDDPIDKRAWTLQEKALSVRTLRYSTLEVQWNCLMRRSCECDQPPTDDVHFFYNFHSLLSRFPNDPIKAWGVTVEDYTNRSLNYDEDIFPALSGLARSMAVEIKSQYVAGLWISSSPLFLLWKLRGPLEAFPAKYVAPTFSWASTRRQAIFPSIAFDRTHIEILSVECCPDSSDSFGRIKGASLEVQGQLIPALLSLNGSEEELRLCEAGTTHFIFEADGPIVAVEVSAHGDATAQRARSPTGGKAELKNVSVQFLPLISRNSGDYCEVHGLILGRSSLGGGYERLGFAQRWSREDEFPWMEESTFRIF